MHEAVADAAFLREQAEMCVRLANSIEDKEAAAALRNLATKYEIIARRVEEHSLNGAPHLQAKLPPQT